MKRYAQLHLESLQENRPDLLQELRRKGKLRQHLKDVQRDAQRMRDQVRKDLVAKQPYKPAKWNNSREAWEGALDRIVEELVLNDLVLVSDPDDSPEESEMPLMPPITEPVTPTP